MAVLFTWAIASTINMGTISSINLVKVTNFLFIVTLLTSVRLTVFEAIEEVVKARRGGKLGRAIWKFWEAWQS